MCRINLYLMIKHLFSYYENNMGKHFFKYNQKALLIYGLLVIDDNAYRWR